MCKLMRTIRQALSPIQKKKTDKRIQGGQILSFDYSRFLYTVALKCALFKDASGE